MQIVAGNRGIGLGSEGGVLVGMCFPRNLPLHRLVHSVGYWWDNLRPLLLVLRQSRFLGPHSRWILGYSLQSHQQDGWPRNCRLGLEWRPPWLTLRIKWDGELELWMSNQSKIMQVGRSCLENDLVIATGKLLFCCGCGNDVQTAEAELKILIETDSHKHAVFIFSLDKPWLENLN